jgi:hypothetical protein
MIEPSIFIERWQKQIPKNLPPGLFEDYSLIRVSPETFVDRNIPEASKKFLTEAGLPKSAAPYLSFEDLAKGLHTVWEIWGVADNWNEADRSRLQKYFVIGSDDNSGNPICIDQANGGQIVTLEHEDWFTSVMFVNSSVQQLAEFLLLFNEAVKKQQIVAELEQVDPVALKKGSFWSYVNNAI